MTITDDRIANLEKHCNEICQEENKGKACPKCPNLKARQDLYKERTKERKLAEVE